MAVMQANVMSLLFATAVASASLRGAELPGAVTGTDSKDQTSKLVPANSSARSNATTSAPERALKVTYFSYFSYYPGEGKHRSTTNIPDMYRRASSSAVFGSDVWVKGGAKCIDPAAGLARKGDIPFMPKKDKYQTCDDKDFGMWKGTTTYVWANVPNYKNAEYLLVATGDDALYIDQAREMTETAKVNSIRKRRVWFGREGGSGWVLSLQPNDGEYWGKSARTCFKFVPKNRGHRWSKFPCWGISGP